MEVLTIFLVISIVNANSDVALKENVEYKLEKVLEFIDEKFNEFHFDGLLGITFTHAFLIKSLMLPLWGHTELEINVLINKCTEIHNKIYPLLPNHPEYMISFRNNLLDAKEWDNVLPDQFEFGRIKYMGYYTNWTSDTIIQERKARYKGIKSDFCLREILEISQPNHLCYVSDICEEMMLDVTRIDTGYLLTHRLLYMQVVKLHNCVLPKKYWDIYKYISMYCSYIYKEARTSEKLNFPHYDIFLEQVVLCGMEGYAEFLNIDWLSHIMQWQNPHGCYESVAQNITRRTSFQVDFGCSDHTTGLGAAALALHLRYLLNNHFMYSLYKN